MVLSMVLKNNFYDIIVNIYFNLSDIYLFSGNEVKAEEVMEEARNYFSNEEEKYDEKKNYYMLSQIYQIQKNLNSTFPNSSNFRKYSRKEAYSYIELGKKSLHRSCKALHSLLQPGQRKGLASQLIHTENHPMSRRELLLF